MTANTSTESPLERAAAELRDICADQATLAAPFDAASLARMRVHIININHSVLESTQDHLNAAKRLNDFSRTLGRSAKHFAAQNGDLAVRLTAVAGILHAAGEELANADTVPKWPTPAISG